MLDTSRQEIKPYPNVVLIDFGCATQDADSATLSHECRRFHHLMLNLATTGRGCKPKSHWGNVEGCVCGEWWIKFVKFLDTRWIGEVVADEDEERRIFVEMEEKRGSVDGERKERVEVLVERAMGNVKVPSEAEIRTALVEGGYSGVSRRDDGF